MTITQQYALDLYRATKLAEYNPPAPGRDDWRMLREFRDHRLSTVVAEGRPAQNRWRAAAARLRPPRLLPRRKGVA
jgi:hypothetical protein